MDDLTRQLSRHRIALGLDQMPLQDGRRRPLAELGFEDRRESEAPACPLGSDLV
jgi:hypothetical protein